MKRRSAFSPQWCSRRKTGVSPGLLATALSAVASDLLLLSPLNTVSFHHWGQLLRLVQFQVVRNLIANAITFTPAGGIVDVDSRGGEEQIVIQVTDAVIGTAPDFLPHLFERFEQADQSSTQRHGGLGLGLAIVRHLVELHRGTVLGESDGLGKGATFGIVLPRREPAPPTDQRHDHESISVAARRTPRLPAEAKP